MSTVEERKALDRMAESYRRIVGGARAGARPPATPAEEGPAGTAPGRPQGGPQAPQTLAPTPTTQPPR